MERTEQVQHQDGAEKPLSHLVALLDEQERDVAWLAKKTGYAHSIWSRVLAGETKYLRRHAMAAAAALDADYEALLPEAA